MNIKRVSGIVTLILLIAGMLSGCSKTPDDVIVVGASAVPHALILEQTREPLEAMGYELDIRIYSDYVLPNTSLVKGELDDNFFSTLPIFSFF
ncbi:MAG: MetQ/NlpA family ABC transporter substrate-binding protein [Eubacteriales bacterium]